LRPASAPASASTATKPVRTFETFSSVDLGMYVDVREKDAESCPGIWRVR
jgi:hypothetical protein